MFFCSHSTLTSTPANAVCAAKKEKATAMRTHCMGVFMKTSLRGISVAAQAHGAVDAGGGEREAEPQVRAGEEARRLELRQLGDGGMQGVRQEAFGHGAEHAIA